MPDRSIDFGAVGERRRKVIKTLTGGVGGLMKKNGIDVIEGVASLTPDGNVRVGEQEFGAKTVVIATGSIPKPVPGTSFGGRVIATEEAWALEELPETMAVIGAGASGAEIASAYGRMGTQVLLFEALDRVLPTEDADISKVAGRALSKQNIEIHTGTLVENVQPGDSSVSFSYGDKQAEVDWLVIAAGRGPDIEALGLDAAGVKLDDRGLVDVDGRQRTSKENVYAIGDIVHGPALAHKSSDEGIIAVEDAAGMETHALEYADIPRATFCAPNVASFGLTEEQAREQGLDIVVGKLQYGAVGAGHRLRGPLRRDQDHRRQEVRRARRRPHRRRQGGRPDPGAGQREGARGRLCGGRADRARPPDVLRGRDGSGPRGRWLARPRLSCACGPRARTTSTTSSRPRPTPTTARSSPRRRARSTWASCATRASAT